MWTFLSKGGWIAVVAVLVVAWVGREIKAAERRGELRAQVEQVQRSADSILGAVRDSLIQAAARDSARADSLAAVTDGLTAEMGQLRRSAHRSRRRADSLLAAMPDSQAVPIRVVIDTLERTVEVCDSALGTCREETAAVRGQLEAMGRRALNAEALAERQGLLIGELEAGQDRFGLWDVVPWAAAALGVLAALLF